MSKEKDKIIEVCSECLQASCWHGEFMCFESRDAGTVLKPVSELTKLALEHSDNWSDEKLLAVCGSAAPNGFVEEKPPNMISEPLENVEDAKELFKNNPVFNKFVNGIIGLLKAGLLTPEQVLTGCVLATGEYEFHIEPNEKVKS